MVEKQNLISIPEAAYRLNVHTSTIIRWIKTGVLQARQLPNGRWRISQNDLDQLLHKEGEEAGEVDKLLKG